MWRILQITSNAGSVPTIPVELIMHTIMHFQDRCAIWKGCVWAFLIWEGVQISIETTSVGWYNFPHENPTGYLDENQYTRALNTYLSKSPYPGMPLVCILLVGVNLHPPAALTSTPCKTDSVCVDMKHFMTVFVSLG